MHLTLVGCVLRTNHCKWCMECTLRGTRSAYYETNWSEAHNQITKLLAMGQYWHPAARKQLHI